MGRAARTVLLLAAAALSAGACTGGALAADAGPRGGASPALESPRVAAPPTASPQPSTPITVALARRAQALITTLQRYEQRDADPALPRDVCPATFSEIEYASRQPAAYQAEPALADFLAKAAAISWACEMRRAKAIRSGVLTLTEASPGLARLTG